MLTDKQKIAGFNVAHSYVMERLRAEVPTVFVGQAVSMLEKPEHRAELQELVNRIGDAVTKTTPAPTQGF